MNKKETVIPNGTLRLGTDLRTYEKTKRGWKKSSNEFPQALQVIRLFKSHNNLKALIDIKNPKFFKGQVSPDGKVQGARINILPSKELLDKPYPLLAKNLTIHDESSHDHWDVIYQNPNGKYAYLYEAKKKRKATQDKYNKVNLFEKKYTLLNKNVIAALKDQEDILAVPMYTLLHTYMRVGNEMYFRQTGHKGLTTITKKDISIKKDKVKFAYIGKSGVPLTIEQEFPKEYIQRLSHHLNSLKREDFVFTSKNGIPLRDSAFMDAFEKYCGERFYPHIVRSYYATSQAEQFLKHNKAPTKQEIKALFTSIAEKLGHKRFAKKENEWKSSYAVTMHFYLNPSVLEKFDKFMTK